MQHAKRTNFVDRVCRKICFIAVAAAKFFLRRSRSSHFIDICLSYTRRFFRSNRISEIKPQNNNIKFHFIQLLFIVCELCCVWLQLTDIRFNYVQKVSKSQFCKSCFCPINKSACHTTDQLFSFAIWQIRRKGEYIWYSAIEIIRTKRHTHKAIGTISTSWQLYWCDIAEKGRIQNC